MKKIKAIKDVGAFSLEEETTGRKNRMGTVIKNAEFFIVDETPRSYRIELNNGRLIWCSKYHKNKKVYELNFKEIEFNKIPIVE